MGEVSEPSEEVMRVFRENNSKEVARWADKHQYYAEPMPEAAQRGPVVTLLNATPDPLGSVAALCGIYTGRVVRSLAELTNEDRKKSFEDMTKTVLNGALEAAQFHFLIEGVDRAFTHQAVRGRAAFYAQESLRFAVKEFWTGDVPLPPSLAGRPGDDPLVMAYTDALHEADAAYQTLVSNGVPAEEARKLLPHAVTTRYHWITDLRELLHVAGLRTCTQAQFDWRLVMAGVARALREYSSNPSQEWMLAGLGDKWQFKLIADKIRPVCFQTGRCGFMAQFDRSCNIRERVEANAAIGRPPAEWGEDVWVGDPDVVTEDGPPYLIKAIHDHEWAATPGAARAS